MQSNQYHRDLKAYYDDKAKKEGKKTSTSGKEKDNNNHNHNNKNKKQKTINRGPSRCVDQNNDHCEKCGDGGELLCCDTCSAAWHLKCANLKILPAEDVTWSCPKCVEEFVKSDPELKVIDGQIVNGEIQKLETHVPPQYICSAIRDVECPICGYACSSANSSRQQQLKAVKNHMNSNKLHQVSTEKSVDFPWGCKDCNLFFRWEVHLSGHQTTVEAARTLERLEREAEEAARAKLPKYSKNQRVEGNYIGGVKWFGGVIQKVNKDGTYHLRYDDGDIEENVSPKRIRKADKNDREKKGGKDKKDSNDNRDNAATSNHKRKKGGVDNDISNVSCRDDSKDDIVRPSALFPSEPTPPSSSSSSSSSAATAAVGGDDSAPPKKKRGRPSTNKKK